jgi:hypothetical protein
MPTAPKKVASKKKAKFVVPKSPAKAGDLLYTIRDARYALNKDVKEIQDNEAEIKKFLIDTLPKSDASGIAGAVARIKIETRDIPQIVNKAKLLEHIKKTGDFDLLQIRISEEAVKARWDNEKTVPGVGKYVARVVSCTKK